MILHTCICVCIVFMVMQHLDLISESRNNKFIIFSDSLSVLESLKHRIFENPLIRILCKLKNLSNDNDIQICWVPSHTGINGNDQADKATRSTINLTTENKFKIPHTDFKMKINKYIIHQKQRWNNNENNKLLEIKPTLGEWKQSLKKPEKGGCIVQTLDRSYKDNTLLFTRRKTTTYVLCMSDQIHRETHSHRMYRPRPYKKKPSIVQTIWRNCSKTLK